MAKNDRRPQLGGIIDEDTDRIRAYGLAKGFIPTTNDPPVAASASTSAAGEGHAAAAQPAPMPIIRPAPTKPWQAMLPDYLVDQLRQEAAREGTAQKVIVMKALRQAGLRVDDIDLQDLRRR
jgi:hypothetical protein